MKSAGFDPYMYELAREEREYRWEQMRPRCEVCNERIMDEPIEIDDALYHEDCIRYVWDKIQETAPTAIENALKDREDLSIVGSIIERMIETFDFEAFLSENRKGL